MRTCRFTAAALLTLVFLAGCGSNQSTGPTDGGSSRGTIGLSVLTLTNPFFKVIADTLTEEARKHGYEVFGDQRRI